MTKVLVVEDEESLCRLYKEELEEEGYEVMVAKNGHDAMELFENQHPDLVTLDIIMPESPGGNPQKDTGLSLLRRMKAQRPEMCIILSTAYEEFMSDFQSWASDAFIVKSSDLAELKSAISRCIKK